MTAIPWTLFDEYTNRGDVLNRDGSSATAVGMLFLPRDAELMDAAMRDIESIFESHNFLVQAWRPVPLDSSVLGTLSEQFVPSIRQVVVQSKRDSAPSDTAKDFDKLLYNIRREIQGGFRRKHCEYSYVCSLSSKTIVYKGMLRSCDLGVFYRDLQDPRYSSPFALYHRRFSTNTVPKWFQCALCVLR
jgi:glutamate synthase (ferredoxin)